MRKNPQLGFIDRFAFRDVLVVLAKGEARRERGVGAGTQLDRLQLLERVVRTFFGGVLEEKLGFVVVAEEHAGQHAALGHR
jgi:hypothetical protein